MEKNSEKSFSYSFGLCFDLRLSMGNLSIQTETPAGIELTLSNSCRWHLPSDCYEMLGKALGGSREASFPVGVGHLKNPRD